MSSSSVFLEGGTIGENSGGSKEGSDNSSWLDSIGNSISKGLESIKEFFKGLVEPVKSFFKTLLDYLNPFSEKFFLKVAFLPREGYFKNYFSDIKGAFDVKIPIVGQLFDFFKIIATATVLDAPPPQFMLDYNGVHMSIIDFSFVLEYRTIIVNFIRFASWFFFLKRLYNRIPSMIY